MSERPDLLERTRMCIAEVGWPASVITVGLDERSVKWATVVPLETRWRAMELAKVPEGCKPICWHCRDAVGGGRGAEHLAAIRTARDRCNAALPLTEDCGIDR